MRTLVVALWISAFFSQAAHSMDVREATEQLTQAEQRWKTSGPVSYSFTMGYSAFVLAYGCESQTFRVVGSHSMPRSSVSCKSQTKKFGSIPALFRFAHELLAQHPGEVSAKFNSQYGYPIQFYVGNPDLEDDYFQFEVAEFKVDGK